MNCTRIIFSLMLPCMLPGVTYGSQQPPAKPPRVRTVSAAVVTPATVSPRSVTSPRRRMTTVQSPVSRREIETALSPKSPCPTSPTTVVTPSGRKTPPPAFRKEATGTRVLPPGYASAEVKTAAAAGLVSPTPRRMPPPPPTRGGRVSIPVAPTAPTAPAAPSPVRKSVTFVETAEVAETVPSPTARKVVQKPKPLSPKSAALTGAMTMRRTVIEEEEGSEGEEE